MLTKRHTSDHRVHSKQGGALTAVQALEAHSSSHRRVSESPRCSTGEQTDSWGARGWGSCQYKRYAALTVVWARRLPKKESKPPSAQGTKKGAAG